MKILILLVLFSQALAIDPVCKVCKEVVETFQHKLGSKFTLDQIEYISSNVCFSLYEHNTDIYGSPVDKEVCDGLIEEFTVSVIYILLQSVLSPDQICVYMDKCKPEEHVFWSVDINQNKPNNTYPSVEGDSHFILHLTDLHYDPLYTVNATTDCGEPVCCREGNAIVNNSSSAGYWGDYRYCDTPLWTYENLLQYVANNFNVSMVIFTGDAVSHVVWNTTEQGNLNSVDVMYNLVHEYLPAAVFVGTLGNHESSPVNLYPSPEANAGPNDVSWLYNGVADIWGYYMDDETLFRKYGYYSYRVTSDLIVVSLNMNFGDHENWWLLVDSEDPGNMLQWLSDLLYAAEKNKDYVYIIGHQPPYHSLHSFSYTFYDIVYRYEKTILGQFYGHSHHDEFFVFLIDDQQYYPPRAFNMAYIAPSITPYSDMNIGFRLYETQNNMIINSFTYVFNLTLANENNNTPDWYLEYSARKAYGFDQDAIYPQDWNHLTQRFPYDNRLWNDYILYKYKSRGDKVCEGNCKSNNICNMRTSRNGDRSLC